MTTIAHCVDNEMRQRCNDDKTMGTVWPARQIRRPRHRSSRSIGVGVKGSQEGGIGRESWGSIARTTHGGVRVTVFFSTRQCGWFNA